MLIATIPLCYLFVFCFCFVFHSFSAAILLPSLSPMIQSYQLNDRAVEGVDKESQVIVEQLAFSRNDWEIGPEPLHVSKET